METGPLLFSLDSSLGRLARWLRLIGHDAAWESGDDLRKAAWRARSEGRMLLTRSKDPLRLRLSWPPLGGLVIVSPVLGDQIVEVARRWPIFSRGSFLSRCAECNQLLLPVTREEARPHVPPFVGRTRTEFRKCPRCGRLYWTGTHTEAIQETIRASAAAARPVTGDSYQG